MRPKLTLYNRPDAELTIQKISKLVQDVLEDNYKNYTAETILLDYIKTVTREKKMFRKVQVTRENWHLQRNYYASFMVGIERMHIRAVTAGRRYPMSHR